MASPGLRSSRRRISLDEASGDAALRADPDDAEALASALERAVSARDELVAKGIRHARRFRWDDTGRIFLDGLEQSAALGLSSERAVDRLVPRAVSAHVKLRARSGPAAAKRSGASSTPATTAAMSSGSVGSKSAAASPHTSATAGMFEAATGHPHAIASSGGWPKPS